MAVRIFAFAFLLAATPASACDCLTLFPDNPRFAEDVERIAAYYPVAGEGRIQADGPYAWRFIPTREFRGPKKPFYRIELGSDCSIDPIEMNKLIGKPIFLILGGGPERYEAGRCVNLQSAAVEKALRGRLAGGCPSG